MGAVPGGIDTGRQPPMTVPLRHFLVALVLLVAGVTLGVGMRVGVAPGLARLAHLHLLLAGWICVTIMGAMTQFVPVWSGVTLHSRRLADAQLALVVAGLIGFAGAFLLGRPTWTAPFGLLVLAGFWTFAYNVVRTLRPVERYDVTERHFLVALAFLLVTTVLGVLLAIGFSGSVYPRMGVSRTGAVGAHATVAVFGVVLTTVYGALYQLGTMFTQTELRGIDHRLRRIEERGHPLGVVALATGRLVGNDPLARIGGILVVAAALAVCVVLARKLYEMRVEPTPMHTRYAAFVVALALWSAVSLPAWATDPLSREHLLGAAGAGHLLVLGAIGFVVFGTLYHVVPFVVWVHRYSDLLGLEDVPMIDDLYDDRLAAIDGSLLFAGTALIVATDLLGSSGVASALGGVLVAAGVGAFALNVLSVLVRHGSRPIDRILLGGLSPRRAGGDSADPVDEQVTDPVDDPTHD
ncbi:hypothetical protein [Halorubrum sp. F4]|uniref:hypothetical protein n=1 Tax=Halorubrum sp. F4 TaxID=2989715 RepID=UPI00247FDEA8|nr:hypothetical protein [Halorubrum sp. F4]